MRRVNSAAVQRPHLISNAANDGFAADKRPVMQNVIWKQHAHLGSMHSETLD